MPGNKISNWSDVLAAVLFCFTSFDLFKTTERLHHSGMVCMCV